MCLFLKFYEYSEMQWSWETSWNKQRQAQPVNGMTCVHGICYNITVIAWYTYISKEIANHCLWN